MFQNLTERLSRTLKNITGQGRLTEENIKDTLREVQTALLEADVALSVVKKFIEEVRTKAIGQEVMLSLNPGQAFVKIVNDELIATMGEANDGLNLNTRPPAVILMAGLQGSGKTTTTAKLAKWLKDNYKKSILVVSTDVYRPAAIEQLRVLASEIDVQFYPSDNKQKPVAIAEAAIQFARQHAIDVVLIDTAGRLHVDDEMIAEIIALHQATQPIETLFVVDSMTGQDAAVTAQAFNAALPLTGVILTKADGDARGGAALSIRAVTGKPIKFIGLGEKISALELFHPERIASRILGMGDILTLVEQAEQKIDRAKQEKLAKKIQKGKGFDLEDFKDQILQMHSMGGISNLLDKLPGMSNIPAAAKSQINDKELMRTVAIINSMTLKERRFPANVRGSQKQRIAKGSGTQVQDVNRLLKQFDKMQKVMQRAGKMGGIMKMMQGMQGKLPFG